MKRTTTLALIAATAVLLVPRGAEAQRRSEAETGLVGVKLFDSGLRLLDLYGEPDEIQAVGGGGGAAPAPIPGGGAPAGPGGAPGGGGGGRFGRGGGGGAGTTDIVNPFTFGDEVLGFRQFDPNNPAGVPAAARQGRGGGGGLPPSGPGAGGPSPSYQSFPGGQPPSGPQVGGPTASPLGGPTPPPSNSSGSSGLFNRWIYKRNTGKYGFIIDPHNRIVQIEAFGLEDTHVRTRKGLSFGSTFITTVKTYGWPDSYEVSGNSITLRYLLKNKVVFRLNRLGTDKPHQITAIVVAAAKG